MVYQQAISLASLLRPPALFYRLLNILHWLLDILLVRELESSVFFSFKLTTTTCKVRVMFLLQTPLTSSHSRRSRWRRLTNFPVNSALMVAMLVKLLLVLIASNTSPATYLEESFSRSKCALCGKRFFSPFFYTIVDLSQCEMGTSSSGILRMLPPYLRLLEVFRGAHLLVLELPEDTSARRLHGDLEYGLLFKDFSWWLG